jgi:hypothetical protein
MKYFEKEHRVGSDDCAISVRNQQNNNMTDYLLYNMYKTNKEDCSKEVTDLQDFANDNHMNIKEGYGVTNGCRVDNDSDFRQFNITSDKSKTQLFSRIFHAIPDMSRGDPNIEFESKLIQGENTYNDFECHGNAFDVFQPMIPCLEKSIQNTDHIIQEGVRGGEGTRDSLKQREFLEKNGYQFDGKVWSKKQCN